MSSRAPYREAIAGTSRVVLRGAGAEQQADEAPDQRRHDADTA
jgi:hypothetical protein